MAQRDGGIDRLPWYAYPGIALAFVAVIAALAFGTSGGSPEVTFEDEVDYSDLK